LATSEERRLTHFDICKWIEDNSKFLRAAQRSASVKGAGQAKWMKEVEWYLSSFDCLAESVGKVKGTIQYYLPPGRETYLFGEKQAKTFAKAADFPIDIWLIILENLLLLERVWDVVPMDTRPHSSSLAGTTATTKGLLPALRRTDEWNITWGPHSHKLFKYFRVNSMFYRQGIKALFKKNTFRFATAPDAKAMERFLQCIGPTARCKIRRVHIDYDPAKLSHYADSLFRMLL